MIRARSVPLTTVLILTAWNIARAQTDLDFEHGELLSEAWGKRGSAPHNFEISVDPTVSFTGERSGHIKAVTPRSYPVGYGTLRQEFPADAFRGRRVRLSGWVKTVRGEASLWMRMDGPAGRILALDSMHDGRVIGTEDWTPNVIVLDVPADTELIAFGLILNSGGEAWVDGLTFETVGEDVPATNPP